AGSWPRRPRRRCAAPHRRRCPSPSRRRRTPRRRASAPPGRTWTPPPRVSFVPVAALSRRLLGADLDPHEPADCCVLAELAEQLADRSLGLPDERLLHEDCALVEAVEPALDDLGDRLLGLPFVAGQLLEHGPLLLDDVGRDILPRHVLRRS